MSMAPPYYVITGTPEDSCDGDGIVSYFCADANRFFGEFSPDPARAVFYGSRDTATEVMARVLTHQLDVINVEVARDPLTRKMRDRAYREHHRRPLLADDPYWEAL